MRRRRGREKGSGEGVGRRGREKGSGEGVGRRGREKGSGEGVGPRIWNLRSLPPRSSVGVANRIDIVRFYQIDIVAIGAVFPRCHRLLHPKWS
jgi:hypothetical protein